MGMRPSMGPFPRIESLSIGDVMDAISARARRGAGYSPERSGPSDGGVSRTAFRRFRFARSACANLSFRLSALEAGFLGFSGSFRDILAFPNRHFPIALPTAKRFRYADASAGCCRSSVVERILGKAEVGSSILPGSTIPLIP
jgi:hypothetical protein